MDNLIKVYIDMLAQANHDIALLKAENEKLKIEIGKIKKEKDKEEIKRTNINTLPQDKQPLLQPEGDYKEIQAM